jgi:hypothetical protein
MKTGQIASTIALRLVSNQNTRLQDVGVDLPFMNTSDTTQTTIGRRTSGPATTSYLSFAVMTMKSICRKAIVATGLHGRSLKLLSR